MSQKTGFGVSVNRSARARALDEIGRQGKHLPVTVKKVKGSIIQVAFDLSAGYTLPNVTIPHFGPEYIRYPTQKGDRGVVIAIDTVIGAVTGLGGSNAPAITRPGNLASLVFLPIANTNWSEVSGDKTDINGPKGTVSRDKDSNAVVTTDGSAKKVGIASGKPEGFEQKSIDPALFDHHVVGSEEGVTAKSKKKVTVDGKEKVELKSDQKVRVEAPQTEVNGLLAALGIGAIGGGALNTGGGAASGIGAGAMQNGAAATNVGPLGGDLKGTLPNPRVKIEAYAVADLPAGELGLMAVVTDGLSGLVWGAAVVDGGSTQYLCWHNGTGWKVFGV